MALNTVIRVDAYDFSSTGNAYAKKEVVAIPLPAEFVTASSPDPRVYVYSRIKYREGGPGGLLKEVLTAETVSQLVTKANA